MLQLNQIDRQLEVPAGREERREEKTASLELD